MARPNLAAHIRSLDIGDSRSVSARSRVRLHGKDVSSSAHDYAASTLSQHEHPVNIDNSKATYHGALACDRVEDEFTIRS